MKPLDVLSDVLRAVQLTGVVYFDFTLRPPWVAEAPPSREIADTVLPGSERIIEYHLFARGSAWGHAIGGEPIHLREGDLLIFPQGDAHVLSSAPGMRSTPDLSMYARASTPLPLVYELGTDGDTRSTRIICGFFGCDERPYNPLLPALPAVIHLPAAGTEATTRPLGAMLEMAIRAERRGQPGNENVLSRLSELMLVEAIRRYLVELPGTQLSWLAGLRDPIVGRALEAIHGAPRDPWTIESLGRTIGVSRSVLAARFTEMVGHPPMHYLTLWRMQLASRMLHDGQQVIVVARAVGYESEAAFSRAFKKLMGVPPVLWRRRSRGATDSGP
ncbi:MAG TPA: AraC family transcriptional regulator [Vicinamibacterales bacterium]|nr:AraC family transcriptional regulator [Vicinamibacterales bacterium]